MKNMQKEMEEDMLYLKEMLDLQEVLDPEEFCFEKRRFDNNLFIINVINLIILSIQLTQILLPYNELLTSSDVLPVCCLDLSFLVDRHICFPIY